MVYEMECGIYEERTHQKRVLVESKECVRGFKIVPIPTMRAKWNEYAI